MHQVNDKFFKGIKGMDVGSPACVRVKRNENECFRIGSC